MKKDVIYFADLIHNGTIKSIDTFPLGVGLIAAYALDQIGEKINCEIFKMPEDLNHALLNKIPRVMCFANFTWNLNLSIAFAQYVKNTNNKVPIIFGGPNLPIPQDEREEFLRLYPEIDFYIKWDGEHAFLELYKALASNNFDVQKVKEENLFIPNCLYIHDNNYYEGPDYRIADLMSVPSPYHMGLMDKFFRQDLRPLVEFTRGCPFGCTFCNDAVDIRSKVFRKTNEFVNEELHYIAKMVKKCGLYADLSIADLNFGMFKEDLHTARIIRNLVKKYSWPRTIDTSLGKSQPDRVLETVKIMNGGGQPVFKMYSAMQSTDPIVLDAIRRKNLPVEKIKELKGDSNLEHDNTGFFTEFILGLPKESKKSHFNTLRDGIDNMNVDSLDIHQLNLSMGAPLATSNERKKWGFNSKFRLFVGRIGNYKIGNKEIPVGEYDEVVIGNKQMTYEDWIECRQLDFLVKVYFDRALFSEIFEFISYLGLSKFDLLLFLFNKHIRNYPKLNSLMQEFILKVKEPLHNNLDEFYKFITKRNVEKYAKGIIGGNELTIYRAKMYTECIEELHLVLRDACIDYLAENNINDPLYNQYVVEAVDFSSNRKFSFGDFKEDKIGTYSFNFSKAADNNFFIDPHKINSASYNFRFFYDDTAINELEYGIEQYIIRGIPNIQQYDSNISLDKIKDAGNEAQINFNLGKFFHQINMIALKKSFELVD